MTSTWSARYVLPDLLKESEDISSFQAPLSVPKNISSVCVFSSTFSAGYYTNVSTIYSWYFRVRVRVIHGTWGPDVTPSPLIARPISTAALISSTVVLTQAAPNRPSVAVLLTVSNLSDNNCAILRCIPEMTQLVTVARQLGYIDFWTWWCYGSTALS